MPSHTSEITRGARLVASDGRELPLESTAIEATARAGFAAVVLRQRFRNHYAEPLAVRYQVALPADGAVSGFAFTIGARRIEGVIDEKARARERFEEALLAGRGAALLDEERSSLFTQEIGNIPPGATVEAEIAIDQPLAWLAEGAWEWRFPTVVAPRYAAGVADAEAIAVDVHLGAPIPGVRATLRIEGGDRPFSTSHAIDVEPGRDHVVVTLEGALDRDVVVSWPAAKPDVGAELVVARPDDRAYGALTLVPPAVPSQPIARDLVLLVDASGSMDGAPLDQARRLGLALVDSLTERDTLSMIAFAFSPEAWTPRAVPATAENKAAARRWLAALRASGGTEMRAGILAALAPLRPDAQRQVVLMSDGLIGHESEIVRTIVERLPEGSRVHTVGVGSAVNRTLTASAARAGRGVEVILGIGDDVERALARIVHHTAAPAVVGLTLEGSALEEHAPARLPDLFAAAPARIALALRPEGGRLTIAGRTAEGRFERTLEVPPIGVGQGDRAIARRFARERVEDLETERCFGRDVDAAITALGLAHGIATRLTSWVAIGDVMVDPTLPTRRETIPQALPFGMSAAGLGLRAAMPPPAAPPMAFSFLQAALSDVAPDAVEGDGAAGRPGRVSRPPAPSAPAPSRKRARGAAQGTSLEGTIRLRRDDRMVIEIALGFALSWDPRAATLVMPDGTRVAVKVEAHSTRAGTHPAGSVVRLALELPAPLAFAPLVLELDNGSDHLVVTLHA